jgi:hypothetical protein
MWLLQWGMGEKGATFSVNPLQLGISMWCHRHDSMWFGSRLVACDQGIRQGMQHVSVLMDACWPVLMSCGRRWFSWHVACDAFMVPGGVCVG